MRSGYFKNIFITLLGSGGAQIIPLLISPIIARIYAPSEFGAFSILYTLSAFCAIFIAGRYQQAIFLTNDRYEIKRIISICIKLSLLMSIIIVAGVGFCHEYLASFFNFEADSRAFYFIPIISILSGSLELVNVLLIKEKNFKTNATNKVVMSVSNGGGQLTYSLVGNSFLGLLSGQVLSIIAAILNGIREKRKLFMFYFSRIWISNSKLFVTAKRFSRFPVYDIPSNVFNFASSQLPILTFSSIFNLTMLGYYSFASKLLLMPVNLLSKSVLEVFKSESSDSYAVNGNCKTVYIKTLKTLLYVAVVPFSILTFFGEYLIVFVFGSTWAVTGQIIEIMSPAILLKAISSPLSYTFYLAGKQRLDALIQFLFLICVAVIILDAYRRKDLIFAIQIFTYVNMVFYGLYLVLSYSFASRREKNGINS